MQNRVSFIKFADVKVPLMKEVPNKGWVLFGEDNKYPDMLLNMLNKSSKHNGIVLGKVNYIVGNGFEQKIQANKYEGCNEILKKICLDIEIFGGCYIEVQYNELGKKAAIYHVPYNKVRSSKDNTQFFIKDWTSYKKNDEPKVFSAYNPNLDPKLLKNQTQILYYKEYRPGVETYTYPGYMGALNAIQTDIEVSKYHLSTITNGMFASKMISFFEGIPTEEEKREIEKGFKNKFTGSENAGNIVLNFGKDPNKAPKLDDLSSTELDKHFDILAKSIQQEIFAGHQITSPMLFGIKTEGQLGGRAELREAYEIFKLTYANDKQQAIEMLFSELFGIDMKIIPLEPISIEFSENILLQIAPKKWLLEKAGIDISQYPEAVQPEPASGQVGSQLGGQVNENLKNLTGRQYQSLTRIIRKYEKGEITEVQAKLLLKSSLGLSDEEVNVMLSIDNETQEFSAQEKDELLLAEFASCGEPKKDFLIVQTKRAHSFTSHQFNEVTQIETNVLDLIRKDKRITPEVIAETLDLEVDSVNEILKRLESEGRISSKVATVGQDEIIERKLSEPLGKQSNLKPETLNFKIMYSYEGPQDSRNRPFCAKLMELDRLYSRADIERISMRLGYSVWDRRGGWWTQPDGTRSKSCRHEWKQNIVMTKK